MRARLIVIIAAVTAAMAGVTAVAARPATAATGGTAAIQAGDHFTVVGQTAVAIDPSLEAGLEFAGIGLTPVLADAESAGGLTTYRFDVIGDPADGTVEHLGGILFSTGSRFALVSHIVVDTTANVVTGKVNFGPRRTLFTFGASTPQGRTAHLAADGAAALNEALRLQDFFFADLVFGYATTTLDPA